MAVTPTAKPTGKKSFSYGNVVLLFWALFFAISFVKFPSVTLALPNVFLRNILETVWNLFFAFYASKAIVRIWLVPTWKLVFPDTYNLGKKLEWYDLLFEHLKPITRKIMKIRISIVFLISLIIYLASYLDSPFINKYFIDYASLISFDKQVSIVKIFFSSSPWPFLKEFSIFSFVFWLLLMFEGRSRVLSRLIKYSIAWAKENVWKIPLDKSGWSPYSEEFHFNHFTSFVDEKGEDSLNETPYEERVAQNQEGLRTSTIVVGPTGSGKTTCFAHPRLKQAIEWQAQNYEKKASISCCDPKAELTDYIIQTAINAKRGDDLIILSLDREDTINPLLLDNIWEGTTAFKVASWVISAWINAQGGQSSPEPYWENQNYLVCRTLIVLLYSYHDKLITLYQLSKLYAQSSSGCFTTLDGKRKINDFGVFVLRSYLACMESPEDKWHELSKYIFTHIKEEDITDEVRVYAQNLPLRREKQFRKDRAEYHLKNNPKIKKLVFDRDKALSQDATDELGKEIAIEVKKIIDLEVKNKFKEGKVTAQDRFKAYLFIESEKQREKIIGSPSFTNTDDVFSLISDACNWLLTTWSGNDNNTSAIVSNIQPFLQQFESPEFKKIFSSEKPTINFDEVVTTGKIFVPNFPGILIGDRLADGIVTLCKARWQHGVLANPQNKRIKYQLLEEAPRVITLGNKQNNGDLEYCELSRSFGGVTELLTQSISALKAKASQNDQFDKIHGVVRSVVVMATNDPITIDFLQKVTGKRVTKRLSKTIQESAMSPRMDQVDEKYHGESDTLSVSYTESESLENVIEASDVQAAEAFTALAILFDGKKASLKRLALKPHFWPHKRDKWEFLKRSEFSPEKRIKLNIIDLLTFPLLRRLEVFYRNYAA